MRFTQPANLATVLQPLNINVKLLVAFTLGGLALGGGVGVFGSDTLEFTTIVLTAFAGGILGASAMIVSHICIQSVIQHGCKRWLSASATNYALMAAIRVIHPLAIAPGDWDGWSRWLLVGIFLAPVVTAVNGFLKLHQPAA